MEPTPLDVPHGLRGLAAHDPAVLEILRGMREALEARSTLDERTTELVRLGTLVGIGAPADAIAAHVGRLLAQGAAPADVWSAVLAVAPLVGVPRLVAAGPAVEAALAEADDPT